MVVHFKHKQKVLFRHCDPAGIVFFPRYFEMINDCIEHFFDAYLGWPFEELLKTQGVPTAEISARFLVPSRHGDQLVLALTVTKVGRSSLCYAIEATCGGDTRFVAEAVLVHVDEQGLPATWPEQIRTKLKESGS